MKFKYFKQSVQIITPHGAELVWFGSSLTEPMRVGIERLAKVAYASGKAQKSLEISKILTNLMRGV